MGRSLPRVRLVGVPQGEKSEGVQRGGVAAEEAARFHLRV